MISSFRYHVGIAGAGAFAEFLAGALASLPSFHLFAVAGRTDAKRQRVIDAYHRRQPQAGDVREYREAEELIVDPHVDIVILTTPPHLHAPLAKRALEEGKHVLLEKPGGLTAEALRANSQLAARQNRALAVNLVLRYHPLTETVKQLIRRALLGAVDYASLHNAAHRVAEGHWFWDERRSGGILIEHGVHFFEVGRDWFGEAAEARGFALTDSDGTRPRVGATIIHEGNGRRVPVHYYHGFTMDPAAPESTHWDVHTPRGRITLDGWIPMQLSVSGLVSTDEAAHMDALLDAIPKQPSSRALEQIRQAADRLLPSVPRSDAPRIPYERTVVLSDRHGWYEAIAQARFLDFCRLIENPNERGFVTLQDAIADLALAEACTAAETSSSAR
ncbi:Gfo/Idh/MocA family oxidoreductase [Geobacillus sp. FSL W8-0032]|uniref:Inositol 2-dehydrogenase/D-chiro-inositol 3-dehydrogenase n=1 Tax=Geobacillus icigianus TaxID=1430331 RepID=A0ABU6BJE1_9BACL|nr:Gfo/Idh/MocA family oxidoreductase [Geobacillus icigianus]MEB3752005.1 Inositol 2-dehydrogenase/D-chiro-inositol 3-dehydrogenase [Geobacillus icigianus]